MRRKGITYYLNTVKLKLANRRYNKLREHNQYIDKIDSNRKEFLDRFNKGYLAFPKFSLNYQTYFYFKSTDIFSDVYRFHNGFPIGLKGAPDVPLIPIYYGFCLLYTSPSPRDLSTSRMPSSA